MKRDDVWYIPRMWGKSLTARTLADQGVMQGRHVHRMWYNNDETCLGGDSECPVFNMQLEEAMEAWSG